MTKTIFLHILCLIIAFTIKAQQLNTFTIQVQSHKGTKSFISMNQQQASNAAEVKENPKDYDLVLLETLDGTRTVLKWYNLSGKEIDLPNSLKGSNTLINAISLDREQFDNCKTVKDFDRMTGHISKNALSHFASVSDDISKGIIYHCFIVQQENGKRALMWLEEGDGQYLLNVKTI